MPVYLIRAGKAGSSRRVMPVAGLMSERHAAAGRVDDRAQQIAPGLRTQATARANQRPPQECKRNQCNKSEFEDCHGRFLIVVRYGRGGSLVNRISAACEVAHTGTNKANEIHFTRISERLAKEAARAAAQTVGAAAPQALAAAWIQRRLVGAKRCLRACWSRLVADEVCGRSIGYFLR